MTVATKFFDWQRSDLDWSKAPWNVCSPNLLRIDQYLRFV
jgi:hypothetical protein